MSLETESSAVESKEAVVAPEATQNTTAPEAGKEQVVADVKSPAESSSADESKGVKAPSMLDAVMAAAKKPTDKKDGAEVSPVSKAEGKDGESSEAKAAVETEKPPPFAMHPRWQQKLKRERELVKENSTIKGEFEKTKQELERVTAESATQKQVVEQFTAFQGAVRSAGLNPKEVDDGFGIMRLMKTDPKAALEKLQPYVEALQSFVS